ncbi:MAG: VWA domain-containing protein [Ignavibacteriae bacterium]|nr:MAG: VWA domain-containing protein [Ignavibacteriota bacterium]
MKKYLLLLIFICCFLNVFTTNNKIIKDQNLKSGDNDVEFNILIDDYITFGYNDFVIVNPEFEKNAIMKSQGKTMTNEEMKFMEFYTRGRKKGNYWAKPLEQSLWNHADLLEQDNDFRIINEKYLHSISQSISYTCLDPNQNTITNIPLERDYSKELIALAIIRGRIRIKYNNSPNHPLNFIRNKYSCLLNDINKKIELLVSKHRGISMTYSYLEAISEQENFRILNNKSYLDLSFKEIFSKPVLHFLESIAWEEPVDPSNPSKSTTPITVVISLLGSLAVIPFEYLNIRDLNNVANEVLKNLGEITPIPYNTSFNQKIYYLGFKKTPITAKNYIIFLIDVSGSMNSNNKINEVKKAVPQIIKDLPTTDNAFSVIVYSSVFGINCQPENMPIIVPYTQDIQRIENSILTLKADGSTPMYAGIEKAYNYSSNIPEDANGMIILLADGQQNCPSGNIPPLDSIIIKYMDISRKQKITLSTIAYGSGSGFGSFGYSDQSLNMTMESLANKGGGTYIEASNPAVIKGKFREMILKKTMLEQKFYTGAAIAGLFLLLLFIALL